MPRRCPHIIKHSENGFTYGTGLNYQITEAFTLFIDYQVLPELSIGIDDSSSWKSTNLGVTYTF
ncbi:autotransporter outer membrane beta-barrel domain-containing protein [Paraglaciecola sp. MB-3u-78]|uniref:autotransporter outer membrane beta-barrel domain-containing protein n=1 Tax=Paraglaciecola sp. MB-3u-78 TaxID=2058332 RepID=UPI0012FF0615|nr:autotransporter outer membrane beta-barrel domain-containing protein [Paraglaciecola sp. MB-3u-78]